MTPISSDVTSISTFKTKVLLKITLFYKILSNKNSKQKPYNPNLSNVLRYFVEIFQMQNPYKTLRTPIYQCAKTELTLEDQHEAL